MEQYFLGMKPEKPIITTATNIFEDLNKSLTNWTYAVVSDIAYKENGDHALGIRLYIPGRILYSYILTPEYDVEKNIKKALYDSCCHMVSPVVKTTTSSTVNETAVPTTPVQPSPTPVTETKDTASMSEIMEMIAQNQKEVEQASQPVTPASMNGTLDEMFDDLSKEKEDTKITTMEQLSNDERDKIPFEELSENVASMMHTGIQEDVPEDPRKFTPRQIEAMKALKERLQAIDETENVEMVLARFINTWNPKFSGKKDLTNRNVDDFMNYTDRILASMGK